MLQHSCDRDRKDYSRTNCCEHAAIIGNDGIAWAVSSDWPLLKEYNHTFTNDQGGQSEILVNEFNCAMGVANGNRSPCAAGILMGSQKYAYIKQDDKSKAHCLVSAGKGGACVGKLAKCIIIATWNNDAKASDGSPQNMDLCADQVGKLMKLLQEHGF